MAMIAEKAGVAVQTIYSQVGSKQDLLLAILDRIEELAAVDAYVRELQDVQAAAEKIEVVARFQRRFWEQGRDVVELAFGSAPLHADLTHLADLGNQRHKRGQGLVIAEFERVQALKPDLDTAQATAILASATSFGVYRWLVDEFGWTGEEYERWLTDTLRTLLLDGSTS